MRYSKALSSTLQYAALSFHMGGQFGTHASGQEGILHAHLDGTEGVWNPLESSTQALELLGKHDLKLTYHDGKALIDSKDDVRLFEVEFNSSEVNELIALQGGFSALGLSKEVRRMMAGRFAVTAVAANLGRSMVEQFLKREPSKVHHAESRQ